MIFKTEHEEHQAFTFMDATRPAATLPACNQHLSTCRRFQTRTAFDAGRDASLGGSALRAFHRVASIEAGMLAVTRTVAEPSDVVMEGVETFSGAGPGQRHNDVSEIVAPLGRDAFDPARILQVLCNLLSNAITFTAAQGRVVLRVEHVDEDVVISVSDRGDDS